MLAPLPLPAPLIALALAVAGVEGAVTPAARLVTSTSSRGYETVTEALAAARPGDTVRLARGVHAGPLVLKVSGVALIGPSDAIVDGERQGTRRSPWRRTR